jgi:hypothetical protein
MSEFKHWLDESSDADDFERAILHSGLDADPSPAKCDEVWAGITGALAVPPLLTTAAAGTAKAAASSVGKTAAVWLGIGKGFVLGVAVYGAAAGVSEVSKRFGAERVAPIASVQTTKPVLPRVAPLAPIAAAGLATTEAAAPTTIVIASSTSPTVGSTNGAPAKAPGAANSSASTLPSVAAFDDPASAVRASQLQAEAQALRSARAELRSGGLAEAFATLEASRRQFSAPELYQEREALMIELLQRSGQVAAARERANAFLSRFPESPHAEQIRRLVLH